MWIKDDVHSPSATKQCYALDSTSEATWIIVEKKWPKKSRPVLVGLQLSFAQHFLWSVRKILQIS